jgi:hypothetical protein
MCSSSSFGNGSQTVLLLFLYLFLKFSPNDPKITSVYGNRNQIFSNILRYKFEHILIPIGKIVVDEEFFKYIECNAFQNHVLLHELSHTLGIIIFFLNFFNFFFVGPSFVENDNSKQSIVSVLTEVYSVIEETKADVLAEFSANFIFNSEKNKSSPIFTQEDIHRISISSFVSKFRSIRFGRSSAHAKGNVIQINWLIKNGFFIYYYKVYFLILYIHVIIKILILGVAFIDKSKTSSSTLPKFSFDFSKYASAITSLAEELLTIKVHGDRVRADKLISEYGSNLFKLLLLLLYFCP